MGCLIGQAAEGIAEDRDAFACLDTAKTNLAVFQPLVAGVERRCRA